MHIGYIPAADYQNYRLDVMFEGYKWDLQAGEQGTISDAVVLLDRECMDYLAETAAALYHETVSMERAIRNRPDLALHMGISERMADALCGCIYNPNKHIRMMRFDFHPTTNGWQISEVNSDVPAGYPEASILPELAARYFESYEPCSNFSNILAARFTELAPPGSTIAYLHDTHTVEDYQVLRFMGDLLEQRGFNSMYADPSHLKWENGKAVNIGAIMRYYPIEWLEFHKDTDWRCFRNAETPSCNHPIALLTQSKRLPLVWNDLDVAIPYWRRLLPKTECTTALGKTDGWILKPAFGRVGEGINIPNTISNEENQDIRKAASEHPLQWVAQEMFKSVPVDGLHLNLGVFVVDGQFAGLYGRASKSPRIDTEASEIPALVKKETWGNGHQATV